jgi:hypothetical protein
LLSLSCTYLCMHRTYIIFLKEMLLLLLLLIIGLLVFFRSLVLFKLIVRKNSTVSHIELSFVSFFGCLPLIQFEILHIFGGLVYSGNTIEIQWTKIKKVSYQVKLWTL